MTNKITNQLHETHAKRLAIIINPQSQFAQFLKKAEFNSILKIELNTLAAIEKILPESKLEEKYTSETLVKSFNEITKEDWKLDKEFKYDDEGDLIDNINYLPKYCLNIFKANIDDLVEGKKVNVEQPNINFKNQDATSDAGMDAANAFNMGAMGFGGMSSYENPLLAGKAYSRLREDFASGKVYQFKTKPKAIPIVKWVLLFLLGLSILGSILTGVGAFLLNKAQYYINGKPDGELPTISAGMFYIILAGFEMYVLITTALNIAKGIGKKNRNDNYYYSFNWAIYLCVIVLGILINLMDLWTWTNVPSFVGLTATQSIGFNIWKYMIIVGSSLSGLMAIPMGIGAAKAPKPDLERMESILHQYIDEMVGGPSTPSTGVDVQKPVDVKPTNDKPTEEQPA